MSPKYRIHGLITIGAFAIAAACSAAKPDGSTEKPATFEQPVALAGDAQCEGATGGGGPKWLENGVGYQIWVRSFADSNGDGTGDLAGIVQRLDYLNDGKPGGSDLGVDILWLSPIFVSPSKHGYDTTDHLALAQDIGTKADLKKLLDACHQRGVAVILDFVVNHVSRQHPWFKHAAQGPKSVKRDWFSWRDKDPGWTQPWSQAKTWHKHATGYYYGVFWEGMPDLNLANPTVEAKMTGIMSSWLDFGVDGFRLDAARYLVETGKGAGQSDTKATHDVWKRWRKLVDQRKDVALIGEVWTKTPTVRTYLQGDELHGCFDFDATSALRKGLELRSSAMWRKALCAETGMTTGVWGRFAGNHDMVRLADVAATPALHKLALGATILLPGTPWLYYGDEIRTQSGTSKGDQAWREPLSWAAVTVQQNDDASVLSWTRSAIALRNASPSMRAGPMRVVEVEGDAAFDVAVIQLGIKAETVVALNFSEEADFTVPDAIIGNRTRVLDSGGGAVKGNVVRRATVAVWQ